MGIDGVFFLQKLPLPKKPVMKIEEDKPKFNSVWVIDDMEVDLFLADKIFENHAEVESMYLEINARKALRKLKRITDKGDFPDLLLLDVQMKGMDGFEFLDKLETFPLFHASGCKICLISAYFSPLRYTEQAETYPFIQKLITKPLHEKHLAELN